MSTSTSVKKQRFQNTKTKQYLFLEVDPKNKGQYLIKGKSWTERSLRNLNLILAPEEVKIVAIDKTYQFGNPAEFSGKFCKTQGKGSSPSWGTSGGAGKSGRCGRAPKS
jgi:hypothetical protein